MREGLYVSESLLLLALAVRGFVLPNAAPGALPWRASWASLVLLGLVAGFYWITREEGAWLFPSLAIILAWWLWTARLVPRPWTLRATWLALPLVSAALVVGAIDMLNRHWYGVFRNNDFRSTDFLAAYGALARIEHDHWQRYVVFPRDARRRAYRFSPAARELAPGFEGRLGEKWTRVGCTQMRISPCPEILSGWFMWALRDAVALAGHYRSANEARAFYERLASEIDAGCDRFPQECGRSRRTLVPPWRREYMAETALASWEIFRTLITMSGAPVRIAPSVGDPRQLDQFARITNEARAPLAQRRVEAGSDSTLQLWLAQRIAPLEQAIAIAGIPAALLGLCVWCISAIRRKHPDGALVLVLALAAATTTRVVLLGFLDATSLPANNMLYLTPVAPIALALVPTVLFGIASLWHNTRRALPAPQSTATAAQVSPFSRE
jgi:hypothetical protein